MKSTFVFGSNEVSTPMIMCSRKALVPLYCSKNWKEILICWNLYSSACCLDTQQFNSFHYFNFFIHNSTGHWLWKIKFHSRITKWVSLSWMKVLLLSIYVVTLDKACFAHSFAPSMNTIHQAGWYRRLMFTLHSNMFIGNFCCLPASVYKDLITLHTSVCLLFNAGSYLCCDMLRLF